MSVESMTPPRDWHHAFAALPDAAAPPDSWARLRIALDAADAADGANASRPAGAAAAANGANAAGAAGPANAERAPSRQRRLPLALAATLALLAPVLALRVIGDATPAGSASTASIPATPHHAPADRTSHGPLHAARAADASTNTGTHEAGRSPARVDARPAGRSRSSATADATTEHPVADAAVSTRPGRANPVRVAASPRRASLRGLASADAAEPSDGTAAAPAPASSTPRLASRTVADQGAVPASEPQRLADVVPHGASASPVVDPLQPLYAEAAQIEALLALTRDDRVASASGAALGNALADRIASIDFALAQPGLSEAERAALWRERVAGLRQLAGVESTERWLALHGRAYGDAFVRVD